MFRECTSSLELHEILRTLSSFVSNALAPSNDHFFLNILSFIVFLIHDRLVLCSATCIALDCLFWELFCPFFQSRRGSWYFFTFPSPSYSWVIWGFPTTSLSAYADDLHIYSFFSDLIPLVKMHISEHLYNSPPEIADDNYWYQGFFFLPKALRSLIL